MVHTETAYFFCFRAAERQNAKWSPDAGEGGGATELSCQLPPLRAEGSKKA